jgi:hypothetical protein
MQRGFAVDVEETKIVDGEVEIVEYRKLLRQLIKSVARAVGIWVTDQHR